MRGFNRWMVKDLYGFQVLWPTLNSDDIVGSYKMGLDLKRKNEDKLQDSQKIHVIFYLYHFGKTINEPFRFPSKIKIRVVLSCRPACVRTHKTSTKRAINAVHNTCIGPLPAPWAASTSPCSLHAAFGRPYACFPCMHACIHLCNCAHVPPPGIQKNALHHEDSGFGLRLHSASSHRAPALNCIGSCDRSNSDPAGCSLLMDQHALHACGVQGLDHTWGRFSCQFFFWQNGTVTLFVVIWQLMSNHGLIRLKRFVSFISSELCN
jgi:hypothetical protein